jgi:modulator of FtsH protease
MNYDQRGPYSLEPMSTRDKLFGTTTLEAHRAETIKQTYLLLGLSVAFAVAGGWVGANTPWIVNLFNGWLGWILAMVLINVIPRVAIAARHNPVLGVTALVADGFVSGLVLAPILAVASFYAPQAVKGALAVTGLAFGGVTTFVMVSNRRFSAPGGLMTGIFVSLIGAVVLNGFLNLGWLAVAISAGVGVMGVMILIYATSEVLHSPDSDSPIPGALMLFAGLFNIFVAALNILLRLAGGGRR